MNDEPYIKSEFEKAHKRIDEICKDLKIVNLEIDGAIRLFPMVFMVGILCILVWFMDLEKKNPTKNLWDDIIALVKE